MYIGTASSYVGCALDHPPSDFGKLNGLCTETDQGSCANSRRGVKQEREEDDKLHCSLSQSANMNMRVGGLEDLPFLYASREIHWLPNSGGM
jgi:hypothetical protein